MPVAAAAALLGINVSSSGTPTRVIQIMNMIALSDLLNDDEYEDLLEDVREECTKFGTINSIYIPRPQPSENGETNFNKPMFGVGRVCIPSSLFLQFIYD